LNELKNIKKIKNDKRGYGINSNIKKLNIYLESEIPINFKYVPYP